jgi:hypothetical protein
MAAARAAAEAQAAAAAAARAAAEKSLAAEKAAREECARERERRERGEAALVEAEGRAQQAARAAVEVRGGGIRVGEEGGAGCFFFRRRGARGEGGWGRASPLIIYTHSPRPKSNPKQPLPSTCTS